MAPTGSSTLSTFSTKDTLTQTSTPATRPMIAALGALTNPLGAVIATNPARRPFPDMDASGFPLLIHMWRMAPNVPVQPASIVVTAMVPIRRLPLAEAPSVLPGLNPNQPKARMKQPIRTADMSCPMIGLAEPSRLNLPMRGPTIRHTASAVSPPTECTTPEPAKSAYPLPNPRLVPSCDNQPPPHAQLANSG